MKIRVWIYSLAALCLAGCAKSPEFAVSGNILGADGERIFSKAHPNIIVGGTQSNAYAGSFSEANLGKAETLMQNFCDDDGNVLGLAPDTIIIPNDYALKQAVFAVLGADKWTGGSTTGAANEYNYLFGRWNVIVWPYLNQFTSGSPWILMDSNYNKQVGTSLWFDRVAL